MSLSFLFIISTSLFYPQLTYSQTNQLKVSWLGTSCISLSDGKTTLLFDPYITQLSLWDALKFSSMPSDKVAIKKWLKKIEATDLQAIFVSHTHFDHAIDLVEVAKQTKATIYGSPSALNIAMGGNIPNEKLSLLNYKKQEQIGKFKITALLSKHPSHFFDLTLAGGKIEKPLKSPSPIYKYSMGQVYSFLIEHPLGTVLFHPSPSIELDSTLFKSKSIDLLVQGIGNAKKTQELIKNVVEPANSKYIMPVHHDAIFKNLNKAPEPFILANLDKFKETVIKKKPSTKFIKLNYGEQFQIQKK
jgi:L-ascorbate metabolism protein UlaG (beta-lactamase superfamily)